MNHRGELSTCWHDVIYEWPINLIEGFTLSNIIGVEVVEGISRRSGSGLVHKVDQSSMVGREADAARPDLGILD